MKCFKTFILFAVLIHCLLINQAYSQTLVLDNQHKITQVKNTIAFQEDKSGKQSFNDVIVKKFLPVESDIPNFGISSSCFWLRLLVENKTSATNYLLKISQPGLDEIELYYYNEDSNLVVAKAGEYMPFNQRQYFDANYIFKIEFPTDEKTAVYLKVKARDNIQVPISIGTEEIILESNKTKDTLMGIYIGVMLIMLFYNTFLLFTIKDNAYFYYLLHLIAVILTQTSIQGFTFQYLWPNLPVLAGFSSFVFPPLVGIAGLYFMRIFLSVTTFFPRSKVFFRIFTLGYLLAFLIAVLGYFQISFVLIEIVASAVSVFMLVIPYRIYKKGYRPAQFFLLAWSIFLIGVALYVMKDLGVLPYNNFTNYMMPAGSAIEVVLLSLALADRINILKKEKEDLIREQNITLETKVNERTAELTATNKSLKEAESNLINAEKMASLGQLTAGISHEINNPINFVVSNVKPLKRDVQEILLMLSKYLELKDGKDFEEKQNELIALRKKLDVAYLTEEINLLLQGIDEGANRTAEIIKGLKNFSRSDEADIKKANIHEGIDATLLLLNSNIQNKKIKLIKNYGQLPLIDCYPGKLNQVFMNLLNNAIQSISSQIDPEKTQNITIETKALEKNIVIKISDAGKGIPKANLSKIFEPFFTTKDVGEGTGLGLSIVYGIIKFHEGDIKVESEEGVGSSFIITLPIQLQKKDN